MRQRDQTIFGMPSFHRIITHHSIWETITIANKTDGVALEYSHNTNGFTAQSSTTTDRARVANPKIK